MSNPLNFLSDLMTNVAGGLIVLAIRDIIAERKEKRCSPSKKKHR